MMRHTNNQIEDDYKKAYAYFKKNAATLTSLEEIASACNLSKNQLYNSLRNHPRVFNKIAKILAENNYKKAEQVLKVAKSSNSSKKLNSKQPKNYVIDASISGTKNVVQFIQNLIYGGSKIVLTSITIKELDKLQKVQDASGIDARHILSMAAGNLKDFVCVFINQNIGIPDDCIIKYCVDNKDEVILITSDKSMELKARAQGVETKFLKKESIKKQQQINNTHTLFDAKKIGKDLYINCFLNSMKSITCFSKNIEYKNGLYKLHIGDDVYIATYYKELKIITFAHYSLISLNEKNNCQLVFNKKILHSSEIANLPGKYKSFVREFKYSVNFK